MKRLALVLLILSSQQTVYTQVNDSVPYNSYRDKIVLYSDLGFKSAPFTIKNNFPGTLKKLSYKHNINPILGLGVAYKWFGLRLGIGIPAQMKPVSRFGKSNSVDLGVKFNIKQTFWDLDFRNYSGFAIKDAYKWNDTLTELVPNDLRPSTQTAALSINTWYIRKRNYKMPSVFGVAGDFNQSTGSWYFKGTLGLFNVNNTGDSLRRTLIPIELTDSLDTKTRASTIFALEMGVIPGYAYTYRNGFWQVSGFGGLGAVIQTKAYSVKALTRGFLGLAPRIDLRFIGGFSKPKYFLWFVSDFDIRSIGYQDLKYSQTYYSLQLMGGIRLDKKDNKKKKRKKA